MWQYLKEKEINSGILRTHVSQLFYNYTELLVVQEWDESKGGFNA